ncbi:angiopoietin-related protein 7-like [Saccostrea cucullata]|uniref:angiopoietin-related protein 7-like n=1 Tax=Saccostrea cuccullata TaxID=36930 RepID=UPI002ED253AF
MMSLILVLFFMSIHHVLAASLLTGTNDPNSLIHDRREIKEIDVLRQLINQETLIRFSIVKDVKATVDDVNSVKRNVASTETQFSSLQQTLNGLKNQVDSLAKDKRLAEKAETLQREVNTLSRQNRILTQKIENLEKQVEVNKTNFLQQMVDALQRQVTSMSQEQRRENKKIAKNCENKIQEIEQRFNRNLTEIYELLNNRTLQTVTKDSKIITDCKDHFLQGYKQSGIYSINPFCNETQVHVYCDMETEGGGWTAIQKRVSGSVSFDRTWVEYKDGFGSPNDSYWIGNDVIHQLTKGRNSSSSLYVSIMLQNGTILYELYRQFSVSDGTDKYKLFLGGPATGTLGDAMLDTGYSFHDLSGMSFSTPDRDNDGWIGGHCAARSNRRGGWWFNRCHNAFLNGQWSSWSWYRPWYPTVNDRALVRKTMMLIKRH